MQFFPYPGYITRVPHPTRRQFQVFGINHSRRELCLQPCSGVINRYLDCQALGFSFVDSATVTKTSAKVTTYQSAFRLNSTITRSCCTHP